MTSGDRIPPNLRPLLILEAVASDDGALTPTEINQQIGLPKQTIHRLVTMLAAEGFLIREPAANRFRPSRRSRLLGAGLLHASRFHIVRHQILQEVSDQVNETVNFVVPEESGMHYLDRIETDWPFRIQMPIGSNVPFHCSASGKIYMASLSKSARVNFVAGLSLTARTNNTHTRAETLLDDLAVCAKREYALDAEEYMEDMVAAAVPVTDSQGNFVAALAVHGPKQRLSLARAEAYRGILRSGAIKLKKAIFS